VYLDLHVGSPRLQRDPRSSQARLLAGHARLLARAGRASPRPEAVAQVRALVSSPRRCGLTGCGRPAPSDSCPALPGSGGAVGAKVGKTNGARVQEVRRAEASRAVRMPNAATVYPLSSATQREADPGAGPDRASTRAPGAPGIRSYDAARARVQRAGEDLGDQQDTSTGAVRRTGQHHERGAPRQEPTLYAAAGQAGARASCPEVAEQGAGAADAADQAERAGPSRCSPTRPGPDLGQAWSSRLVGDHGDDADQQPVPRRTAARWPIPVPAQHAPFGLRRPAGVPWSGPPPAGIGPVVRVTAGRIGPWFGSPPAASGLGSGRVGRRPPELVSNHQLGRSRRRARKVTAFRPEPRPAIRRR